jgi:hypothetical protein
MPRQVGRSIMFARLSVIFIDIIQAFGIPAAASVGKLRGSDTDC